MISEQSQSHIFPKYVKNLSFTVSTGDDHHQDQGGTTWAAKLPLSVASRVNCLLLLMHTRHWCTLLDTGAHYFTLLHAALNVLQCTNLSLCNEHWRCHRTTISISPQQFSKHCFLTKNALHRKSCLVEWLKRREKILSLSLGDQLCCIASYGNKQPLAQ